MRALCDVTSIMRYSLRMTGKELRAWMKQRRWTISALAARLDKHPSTIQRYRDGTLDVPITIELALKALEAE